MQVARFRPDDIHGPSLPRVFPELRQIKLQPLQFCGYFTVRRTIDVESQNQERMLERTRRVNLAILKNKDLATGKEDAVATTHRCEVDA
jgi:hypothetical protein